MLRSNRIILLVIFFGISYFLFYRNKPGPIGSFWHTVTGVFDNSEKKSDKNPYKAPEPDTEVSASNSKNSNKKNDEPSIFDKLKGTVLGNETKENSSQEISEIAIPSFALPAIHKEDDIVKHKNYTLCYDKDYNCPRWVAHQLRGEYTQGRASRAQMEFMPDRQVDGGSALSSDYSGSGYDRGHMVPAGDFKCCPELMNETFYMSNICPQNPDLNRYLWENIEARMRGWAMRDEEIYIVTGAVLTKNLSTIGRYNKIAVPDFFYKIALFYQPNSGREPRAIAFLVPNLSLQGERMTKYIVSVDEVEKATGLDFFAKLPAAVQNKVEAESDWKAWTKIQ